MNYIELNNQLTQRDPETGFFDLGKDLEARDAYLEEVQSKTRTFGSIEDRIGEMIAEDFYYNVYAEYTHEEVREIHELAYSYNFEFASFMAASKFYRDYALKTNDKRYYLETYEEHVSIVSLYLARGDVGLAKRFIDVMMRQVYQPATPTFMNAGRARRGELVSCFLLEMDDNLNSINYNVNTAMQLSKIGGGVAVNLSKLRSRHESIKDIEGVAKGAVPVAKMIETGVGYADQLGQRPGAAAVYLNIFHADVQEFLDAKKINADESLRLSTVSTGLIVPSKFFELAAKNQPYYVFYPYTVHRALGEHLDDIDIDTRYDELVAHPDIKKVQLDARVMINRIAQTQLNSGYPYIFYKSNSNQQHALKTLGQIKQSNLCVEIHQLQETSDITDYGEPDVIRNDISCNLGSLNIVNLMASPNFHDDVETAMRALTAVSDMTHIRNAPGVAKANDELHSVGLGVMNLHGYLAKSGVKYESEEAKEFARVFFAALNYSTLMASCRIAEERGESFKGFEQTEYKTGQYFDRYLENSYLPTSDKVKELFKDFKSYIPDPMDWHGLQVDVDWYGVYHAYRMAIAPTQSISYVQNATSSVLPITDLVERRTYGDSETYYPAPYLSPETQWYYKSAYDTDQMKLIDLIAEIQPHVDQGISTILFVNSDISTRELGKLYAYAHHKGLKSLYYTRTRVLGVDECISCAV